MQGRWLAKLVMFALLEVAALVGVPMRPDQIEELTRMMNRTAVTMPVRQKRSDPEGDDVPNGGRTSRRRRGRKRRSRRR